MEETTSTEAAAAEQRTGGPEVRCDVEAGTARLVVSGELTEAARRPLVREMTDLLLAHTAVHRVELHCADVGYMNSAGMAVLVQLQKLADPRGIEVVLVDPAPAVIRPLQLSGLWHRFPVEEAGAGEPSADG